jgi:hypothetical protein
MEDGEEVCCQRFDSGKWDKKKVTWKNKLFVKDSVFSLFYIPLNFGGVVKKNIKKLKDANAIPKEVMILSDESSFFSSNIYISTKKAIPKVKDVRVAGTFLTKVFEGPYKNMGKWIKEMKEYVKLEKQELKQMYFYYPYCPKCAKKYGNNYVVIFAEI